MRAPVKVFPVDWPALLIMAGGVVVMVGFFLFVRWLLAK